MAPTRPEVALLVAYTSEAAEGWPIVGRVEMRTAPPAAVADVAGLEAELISHLRGVGLLSQSRRAWITGFSPLEGHERMAARVRQWLSVSPMPSTGHDEIWTRTVEMDFLPAKGDKISLWAEPDRVDEDDLFGDPWPVLERRFSCDGHAEIELEPMTESNMQHLDWRDLAASLRNGGWEQLV